MSKKFLAGVLCMLLTVSLFVGCGSKDDSTPKENDSKTEGVDEKVTLNIWGMGEEAKLLSEIENDFETKNPNIDMVVQAIPWDQAHDKLLMAVASGKGPDVVQLGTTWIPEFAEAGVLKDLTQYIDEYPNLDPANYFDSSVGTTKFDGKYIGVPWYVDTRAMFYRTDLLEEVGYPEGPNTWDELKDAATKLSARGDEYYGISFDLADQVFSIPYGWQNGSEIIKDGKPLFNEPEYVEAVKYLNSFFEEGLAPIQDDMDLIQAFKEGIKPMFVSGPWMINIIKNQVPEIDGKWAVRTVPAKENNTSSVGGSNLVIFDNTKNEEAALKFISYMTEVETQVKWFDVAKCLPARTEAWNDDSLVSDPFFSAFGEQMKNSKIAPFIPEWESIAMEVKKSLEEISIGGADIETELDELNKTVEKMLDK
ncbi:sugar ABC transporter substrate-binding protein [Vallitalea guaymasensis]|uniref:Sugar ABC transporter substrate-binding protein n=1 Tax=Vallitalea guaymasensis TaxID=1185412 RepID=A0A8J8SDJ7_9FIRM|nr:sugar ABC transporter substrate-binding protein [Vallitalea guaymasensis]QUH30789.1 sugar ABC transporter substrate-binding protein [Vallitalea guaymasensis]